jgi:hypothetical protein
MSGLIYTIAAVLVFLWLLASVAHVAVNVVGLLLVVAVILVLFNIIIGRRNA